MKTKVRFLDDHIDGDTRKLFRKGEKFELLEDYAQRFIELGIAERIDSPRDPAITPIKDDEWRDGVILDRLLKAIHPEDYGEALATKVWVCTTGPESSEDHWKNKRHSTVVEGFREVLRDFLECGDYELRIEYPQGDPLAEWRPLPAYKQRQVVDQLNYSPGGFSSVYLKGCDGAIEVRVFRRHRRKERPADDIDCGAETEETDYKDLLLTQQYQTVVFIAVERLKSKGDKGGRGFPGRIHDEMGSPAKPTLETVRRYLSDRRRGLR